MSKTTEPTCNSPPMGVLPTAASNLQDSFPAYFASPDRFADLLNKTLLQEHGEPPLDPHDLAPLDIHTGSYRFPSISPPAVSGQRLSSQYLESVAHCLSALRSTYRFSVC